MIKMMSAGIIIRTQNFNKLMVDSSHISSAMTTYSVETEGVLFFHVKYFIWFFGAAIGFAFLILILEIVLNTLLKP